MVVYGIKKLNHRNNNIFMVKVSIIVPVYNVEKYLDRCVNSLLSQTLRDIEIILVDDGSPDRCPELCDKYAKIDDRVKVVHKKNEGLGFARNSGLDVATGEFVAFVDSDDYVAIDMYEKLYNTALQNGFDTVFCCYNVVNADGIIEQVSVVKENSSFKTINYRTPILEGMLCDLPGKNNGSSFHFQVWIAIYSLSLIRNHNIRFCSERQFISEDIIFHIDYLPYTRNIGYLKDFFYFYCYNPVSLTKLYKPNRFIEDLKLVEEMNRRLSCLYEYDYYKLRTDRFLLFKARSSVSYECLSTNFLESYKAVKRICKSRRLVEVLSCYPIEKLSFAEYFFDYLMKKQLVLLTVVLFKFVHLIKNRHK